HHHTNLHPQHLQQHRGKAGALKGDDGEWPVSPHISEPGGSAPGPHLPKKTSPGLPGFLPSSPPGGVGPGCSPPSSSHLRHVAVGAAGVVTVSQFSLGGSGVGTSAVGSGLPGSLGSSP